MYGTFGLLDVQRDNVSNDLGLVLDVKLALPQFVQGHLFQEVRRVINKQVNEEMVVILKTIDEVEKKETVLAEELELATKHFFSSFFADDSK